MERPCDKSTCFIATYRQILGTGDTRWIEDFRGPCVRLSSSGAMIFVVFIVVIVIVYVAVCFVLIFLSVDLIGYSDWL